MTAPIQVLVCYVPGDEPSLARLEVELGFKVASGGMPQLAVWVPDSPFDVDISAGVDASRASTGQEIGSHNG